MYHYYHFSNCMIVPKYCALNFESHQKKYSWLFAWNIRSFTAIYFWVDIESYITYITLSMISKRFYLILLVFSSGISQPNPYNSAFLPNFLSEKASKWSSFHNFQLSLFPRWLTDVVAARGIPIWNGFWALTALRSAFCFLQAIAAC